MKNQGMIALKKKVSEILKKEMRYLGIFAVIVVILFWIAFFKEGLGTVLRYTLALMWLFVLPGYFLLLYLNDKISFIERIIIGILFSAAVIGIISYYIGLIGLNIKYHVVLVPVILIITGIYLASRNKKDLNEN